VKVRTAPHDLVRATVAEDHRAAGGIHIVKERNVGKDAAYAVAFEDRDGVQRRGVVGLRRHDGGVWLPIGGFMGSARVTGGRDVWMTWGGWGSGEGSTRAGFGGWVADRAAVSARVTDATGRTIEDAVENGVVLFLYKGNFGLGNARVDLFDAAGTIIKSGTMRNGADAI
jgi:hypothetical protein